MCSWLTLLDGGATFSFVNLDPGLGNVRLIFRACAQVKRHSWTYRTCQSVGHFSYTVGVTQRLAKAHRQRAKSTRSLFLSDLLASSLPRRQSRCTAFETLFRVLLTVVLDHVLSTTIVLTFFDTKDLDVLPDFLLKRVLTSVVLCSMANSPIESFIQLMFRKSG